MTDNLNRATSTGGVTCSNDIVGNRLTKGSASYGWDALNRTTSYTAGGVTTSYVYRADGMRVSKTDSTGSAVYRYDGQMVMQDVETVGSTVTITNYALGARGVDAVSKTDSSGTSVGYPIYDCHGNRAATLTKSGTSFSLTDVRTYDAWGKVRVGAQAGRPRARYCANLGHVQDDESGLVYMRARYYEPTSGRFVSEDCNSQGNNWFLYCENLPITRVDRSGNSYGNAATWGAAIATFLAFMFDWIAANPNSSTLRRAAHFTEYVILSAAGGYAATEQAVDWVAQAAYTYARAVGLASTGEDLAQAVGSQTIQIGIAAGVAAFYAGYGMFLWFAKAELDAWVDGTVP